LESQESVEVRLIESSRNIISKVTSDVMVVQDVGPTSGCYFLLFVLFVFLALQPIVVVFSQPGSGL
jgi:hypothetical protein